MKADLQISSTTAIDEMAHLPAAIRDEVRKLMVICEEVGKAKSASAGIRAAAARHDMAPATLKRKFYAFKKSGWRGLVNKSKVGRAKAELDIGETFRGYCERNQRSSREGYRTMMRDFHNGVYFPDVGSWREVWAAENPDVATPYNCPLDYTPHGWTYANLMRCGGLTRYEITASRIGRGKAKDYLPSVYSTRVGLHVGQIYQFDDMWHDAKVNFAGNTKAQRIIELACVDVASACRCAYGLKPRREDMDTGRMRNLNECDMRQLLAHILINIGYHPDGCEMIVEHGTAAASGELEQLIKSLSGGAVRFSRSGIISDPVHKGLFCGQPKGNPKRKAALESQHGLAHTVAAALAGQIGKDRDHSPEQMYGLEQYNNQLIKAAAALPPERAKLLMLPLLDFNVYSSAIADLYREMNFRRWHDLEGWEESGYVATQYRTGPASNDWMPMERILDLPPDEYTMLYAVIQAAPEKFSRTVKLSPQEVFDAGAPALVRLPKSTMPQILGDRLAVIKAVRDDGLITYKNQEFGPSEFRYLARTVRDAHGFARPLTPGREYAIHINPFNTDECFVSDKSSGAYIGLATRWQTVGKDNVQALEHQAGKQAHIEAELRAPIARRGQKVIKAKIEMHKNNAAVLRGDAVAPDEVAREERDLNTKISAEEMEAVLAYRPEPQPDFSEDEIGAMIGGDDAEPDEDYSDLF